MKIRENFLENVVRNFAYEFGLNIPLFLFHELKIFQLEFNY